MKKIRAVYFVQTYLEKGVIWNGERLKKSGWYRVGSEDGYSNIKAAKAALAILTRPNAQDTYPCKEIIGRIIRVRVDLVAGSTKELEV